ncbi:MAG: hypothetical protein LDL07_00500 [Desulfarculus sp.]|nr:hypothetical protein [Desulfarculus sp.]
MERQVIFRDRQEAQALDLNNVQLFSDQSLRHLISDAITGESMFVGLVVSAPSATELQVASGRLWSGATGLVYRKDQAETVSVFSQLPVSDQRWLAVSVIGQEIESDIQPRDFLIDLDTGQTEPRAVAMELRREVVVHIQPGLESADPQKPEPPTGYTIIAHVRLNTSGVQEIVLAENKRLMRLFEVWQATLANAAWIAQATPKIASLISDIANLYHRLARIKAPVNINEIAADVALLKDLAQLPDAYASYAGDSFLSPAESDTAHPEFYARVEEGIRFPWAGQTERQPALFNPYETAVKNHDGLILPAYVHVARVQVVDGYKGSLAISQYTYEEHVLKQGVRTVQRVRYGPTREVCTNGAGWQQGMEDYVTNVFGGSPSGWQALEEYGQHGDHRWLRLREYWIDTVQETYWYTEVVEHVIQGAQIAQTFLNSQNGWLTRIGLQFDKAGADGVIHLHLCEVTLGMPDKRRCIGATSVAAADLRIRPNETVFTFPQPVYLEAGKRYALVLTTGGDHHVATVHGTYMTNGTLFHSTDGAYYVGDHERDLMMRLYYAQFANVRTIAELEPLDLASGIADLDLLMEAIVPDSTQLVIEYQKPGDGVWHPVAAGTAGQLLGLPAMLKLRTVFVGSQDLMPGFALSGSRFQAARPATNFRHLSTQRILSAPSEDIDVILDLQAWDETKHTCTCQLKAGGVTYEPTSVSDQPRSEPFFGQVIPLTRRTFNFTPAPGVGIEQYQIQVEGTTTTALACFHVARRMDVAK